MITAVNCLDGGMRLTETTRAAKESISEEVLAAQQRALQNVLREAQCLERRRRRVANEWGLPLQRGLLTGAHSVAHLLKTGLDEAYCLRPANDKVRVKLAKTLAVLALS